MEMLLWDFTLSLWCIACAAFWKQQNGNHHRMWILFRNVSIIDVMCGKRKTNVHLGELSWAFRIANVLQLWCKHNGTTSEITLKSISIFHYLVTSFFIHSHSEATRASLFIQWTDWGAKQRHGEDMLRAKLYALFRHSKMEQKTI